MVNAVQESMNPAADKGRMLVALGMLIALAVLSWFTIDSSAVIHMHGYSNGSFGIADRDVELRWIPMLILGLFALRVLLAYTRARVERRDSVEVVKG